MLVSEPQVCFRDAGCYIVLEVQISQFDPIMFHRKYLFDIGDKFTVRTVNSEHRVVGMN